MFSIDFLKSYGIKVAIFIPGRTQISRRGRAEEEENGPLLRTRGGDDDDRPF